MYLFCCFLNNKQEKQRRVVLFVRNKKHKTQNSPFQWKRRCVCGCIIYYHFNILRWFMFNKTTKPKQRLCVFPT